MLINNMSLSRTYSFQINLIPGLAARKHHVAYLNPSTRTNTYLISESFFLTEKPAASASSPSAARAPPPPAPPMANRSRKESGRASASLPRRPVAHDRITWRGRASMVKAKVEEWQIVVLNVSRLISIFSSAISVTCVLF